MSMLPSLSFKSIFYQPLLKKTSEDQQPYQSSAAEAAVEVQQLVPIGPKIGFRLVNVNIYFMF
jgi:hypothetical protein